MKRSPAILPGLLGLSLLLASLPLAPPGAAGGQSGSTSAAGGRLRFGGLPPRRRESKGVDGLRPEADVQGAAPRDPDLPAGSDVDRGDYIRLRSEYIAGLRGYLPGRRFDPEARGRAIRATARRERSMERRMSRFKLSQELAPSINTDSWTPIGPSPIPKGQVSADRGDPVSGRTLAIAVHPTNPDIVYAGTAAGGLYRTTDGGASWRAIFDEAESLTVAAIAIAPSHPSTVYVGTGEIEGFFGVGVYRIDDADGDSPTLVGPINPVTDQGDRIMMPAFQQNVVSKILVHPTDAATIFVSTVWGLGGIVTHNPTFPSARATQGIFRSRNATAARGAVTFTKLTVNRNGGYTKGDSEVDDMVAEPGNPDTLLCWVKGGDLPTDGSGVYLSPDALAPVPSFTPTLPSAKHDARGGLAVNKSGGTTTVLAATGESPSGQCPAEEFGQLRRSRDGGRTWPDTLQGVDGFCGGQCGYDIAVEMHPTAANPTIHVGGAGAFRQGTCAFTNKRSVDGGSNFIPNDTGLHADVHAVAVAPSDQNIVYTGNDGGIWKSTDGGANWVSLNNPDYNATQFVSIALHPTDREYMAGGTQDNGTEFRGADGSWAQVAQGDGGYTLIDRNATDTANVTIYRTAYNRKNEQIFLQRVTTTADAEAGRWETRGAFPDGNNGCDTNGIGCSDEVLFYAPMALGPGNPNTLYFGTDKLYRSNDKGDSMKPVSGSRPIRTDTCVAGARPKPIPISSISVSPQNDNVRVVGLRNGEVWATTTGGRLTNITPPRATRCVPVGKVFVDPTNQNTAYVTYGGFGVPAGRHVFKTVNLNDSQPTWADSGGGIPDVPVDAFAVDRLSPQHLYAGTDIGVYRSFNGGAAWVPFSEGLPRVPVFDMAFQEQGQTSPVGGRVLRIATHGRGVWEIQLGGDGKAGCQTRLTLSSSRAVTVGSTASCDAGPPGYYHTDTSYWRAFDLASFGVTGRYDITSVAFGIDTARAGNGATQPVTVRLYANNGRAFPAGTLKPLASTTVEVADQTGKILSVPLAADVPAGTSELVMEVFTPDGRPAGNVFFIGANTAAESGPSYMSAAYCSHNSPINLPNVHVVMSVSGSCAAPTP